MMEDKLQKSLEKIKEAIKVLFAEASSEAELIGLVAMLSAKGEKVIEEAIDEGFEEFQRKKEGK
jgi:uncharacterized pyridoxal phosphate-containing UPF0001 family protein